MSSNERIFGPQSIEGHSPEVTGRMLADRAAIVDLTLKYCWALDTKDWALLEEVFTVDAAGDLLEIVSGREAIIKRISSALATMDQTQHLVANHQVMLDGDVATCRCYLQAQHVRDSATQGKNYIIAGRYEDHLVRTKDGWRISFRRLIMMWSDGNASGI